MDPEDARHTRPFDPGLQPERTALAWRRTGLALTVGSLVAFRILPPVLGTWAFAPAGVGLALSVSVLVIAHRRHVTVHRLLTSAETDRVLLPGGGLLAFVAAMCSGAGTLAAVAILDRHMAG
jgi:uncharacterized membrane protein YidH (DUF202 family)